MSDNQPKNKYKNYRFQRFIALARVMTEPELKVMKARQGEDVGIPYCRVFCSTGSPFGTSDDAVFTVQLRGKNAEVFCKEPRKGNDFIFDCQLRTYKIEREGLPPETRTEFIGMFNYSGQRQETAGQPAQAALPITTDKKEDKKDEDVPF